MFAKKMGSNSFQPLTPSQDLQQTTNKASSLTSKENSQDKNNTPIDEKTKVGKAQQIIFAQQQNSGLQYQKYKTTGVPIGELQKHKSTESAWLSLNGTVYDVTKYIKYHPGGRIILNGCGQECSELFNKYHPWVNAQFLLKAYKLGYLTR